MMSLFTYIYFYATNVWNIYNIHQPVRIIFFSVKMYPNLILDSVSWYYILKVEYWKFSLFNRYWEDLLQLTNTDFVKQILWTIKYTNYIWPRIVDVFVWLHYGYTLLYNIYIITPYRLWVTHMPLYGTISIQPLPSSFKEQGNICL